MIQATMSFPNGPADIAEMPRIQRLTMLLHHLHTTQNPPKRSKPARTSLVHPHMYLNMNMLVNMKKLST